MKKICVITGSRAEFGLLSDLLMRIDRDPDMDLRLVVTGGHLSAHHGATISEIQDAGLRPSHTIDMGLTDDDRVEAILHAMGREQQGLADVLASDRPDLVLILGDRYEILPAAVMAVMAGIPLAHIGGGEETTGAVDNKIRHAVSQMADYHFVAAQVYEERLRHMGIAQDRIHFVGALGVERVLTTVSRSLGQEVLESLGLTGDGPLFLVTYHPVTTNADESKRGVAALLDALATFETARTVITGVNADSGGRQIDAQIKAFAKEHEASVRCVESLGAKRYLSVMAHAQAVVGNSSSGIIEAPAMGVPTINIGSRQGGRARAPSIIDCSPDRDAIVAALRQGLDPTFRAGLDGMDIPFPGRDVARQIHETLKSILA